jgi:tryptophan 2,3-dioxygenase
MNSTNLYSIGFNSTKFKPIEISIGTLNLLISKEHFHNLIEFNFRLNEFNQFVYSIGFNSTKFKPIEISIGTLNLLISKEHKYYVAKEAKLCLVMCLPNIPTRKILINFF